MESKQVSCFFFVAKLMSQKPNPFDLDNLIGKVGIFTICPPLSGSDMSVLEVAIFVLANLGFFVLYARTLRICWGFQCNSVKVQPLAGDLSFA